jgi:alcohol-forming fatty acyl-CoA reductase
MGEHDRNLFPVDARCIDWEHYLRKVHLAGLNAFALRPRSAKARKPVVQPETAVA